MSRVSLILAGALVACSAFAFAQEPKAEQKSEQKQEPRRPVNPSARLTAAKTALVRNAEGSSIPYNVISSAIESWGRYQVVDSPDKADIIVEVSSPGSEGSGGVSVSSSVRGGPAGRPEQSTSTSRQIGNAAVRIIVYDARSHMALWSASEQPHFAMKQKAREDNLVEAAQRLFGKFHDRIEPPQQ